MVNMKLGKKTVAMVTVIHKNGPKSDASNYRPILLLSVFSTIYERAMHVKLIEHLIKKIFCMFPNMDFEPGTVVSMPYLRHKMTLPLRWIGSR